MLGRPWPAAGEPLFLAEDTELALAYLAEVKLRCSGCGHPRDETTALDDHRQPVYRYTAGSTVCQACEAVDEAKREIRTEGADEDMDGRKFYVIREDQT